MCLVLVDVEPEATTLLTQKHGTRLHKFNSLWTVSSCSEENRDVDALTICTFCTASSDRVILLIGSPFQTKQVFCHRADGLSPLEVAADLSTYVYRGVRVICRV